MSAGLKEGKDGSMSVSSFLQHVLVGMKFASGPSVEVMKCMQSLIWLCMDVLLCFLQWNKWSPYISICWPHEHFRLTFDGSMGSLWLLRKDSVKSKFFSLFSYICLHGLINVVGVGDANIEGSTFCIWCGPI